MIEPAEHRQRLLANRLVVGFVARDGENRIGDARRNRLHAVGRAAHVRQRAAARLARERRVLRDRDERRRRVRAVGEHGGEERVASGASVDRAGEREQIVGGVLRAHATEIRHAAQRRVRRADVRLNGERQLVGAIDHDAHRAGDARVGAHRRRCSCRRTLPL